MYNISMIGLEIFKKSPFGCCNYLQTKIKISISFFVGQDNQDMLTLSLPQYMIKDRFTFFKVVTFLSQCNLLNEQYINLNWYIKKKKKPSRCKLNTTLNRFTLECI